MTENTLFWLTLAGFIATAVSAIGAKLLSDFSLSELEDYCHRRKRIDRLEKVLDEHEQAAQACESLRVVSAAVTLMAGVFWFFFPAGQHQPLSPLEFFVACSMGALIMLALTLWAPRAVAHIGAAPLVYHTWFLWRALGGVLSPLTAGAPILAELLRRLTGRQPKDSNGEEAFEEEILSIVTAGERKKFLEADARDMIEGVIELHDVDVAEIMQPRSEVDAIDVEQTWEEVLGVILEGGRSRIPVYEKSLDNTIGVLYVKDLLPELVRGRGMPHKPIRRLLRPAWFVSKNRAADDLLRDFLRTRSHLAMVIDEYDSVCGIVTIEDVLEEIVGEIIDETDEEDEEDIKKLDEWTAEVAGRARIDDVNEHLGLDLPDLDEIDTIAGLIMSQLGAIPKPGDHIIVGQTRLTVQAATKRRIEKVRVEVMENSLTL